LKGFVLGRSAYVMKVTQIRTLSERRTATFGIGVSESEAEGHVENGTKKKEKQRSRAALLR